MDNKVYEDGNKVPYTNSSGSTLANGELIHLGGGRVGVLDRELADGESGIVEVEGVFEVSKVSGSTFTVGEVPGIGTAGNTVADDTSALTTIKNGWIWEAASSGLTVAKIKLTG